MGSGQYTITATATFAANSHHAPASTQATTAVDLTADTAIIGPATVGYAESGRFTTVQDGTAYGSQYRETSDPSATTTYTFSGLAPGTYEFWVNYAAGSQHPSDVSLNIYDGTVATGNFLQTFPINEQPTLSTSNWGERSLDGCDWVWAWSQNTLVGTVYSNKGTITVTVPGRREHRSPDDPADCRSGGRGAIRCRHARRRGNVAGPGRLRQGRSDGLQLLDRRRRHPQI